MEPSFLRQLFLLQAKMYSRRSWPGNRSGSSAFSCRRKSCRRKEGSIRAVRGVKTSLDAQTAAESKDKKENATPAPPPPKASTLGLGEALFGVKPGTATTARANPFASASASTNPFAPKSASANPFAKPTAPPKETKPEAQAEVETLPETFAQKLSLNNTQAQHPAPPPPEPWPAADAPNQPSPFPVRWLADAEFEMLDPNPPALPEQATAIMDMDTDTGTSGGGKEDKEIFESAHDSVFQKFADRIGQNPDQCIRYEFAGQPLLYSKSDAVGALLFTGAEGNAKVTTTGAKGIPRCGNCGAGRVFEVQLAPYAIEELETDEDGLDGMDWGTVIVGVCEKDCLERGLKEGEPSYVEEWAGVQWEEITAKR